MEMWLAAFMEAVLSHPVVKAFSVARRGSLKLQLPCGKSRWFLGPEPGPDAALVLRSDKALDAFLGEGSTGLARAYADGLWDSNDIPRLVDWGIENGDALERYFYGRPWYAFYVWLKHKLFDPNSLAKSRTSIISHYDVGNDFYALWLDKSMTYSCALFEGKGDRTLEEAQQAKYARILQRLGLRPGAHILDIGCGWGGFSETAAKQGYRVTGVTISNAQLVFVQSRLRAADLAPSVNILSADYREVDDVYDAIVSIGMFEHVGERYWPTFFRVLKNRLKPGGTAMIQTITMEDSVFRRTRGRYGFIEEFIFPGGMLPSPERFAIEAQRAGLHVKELYPFGEDYALTLRHWLQRFEAKKNQIRALGYEEKFIRLWRLYLTSCIASFESGRTSVMQAELIRI